MANFGRILRWDLFWVRFSPTEGSEQAGKCRPAIVVSNSSTNRLSTVTVVPLTKLEGKGRGLHVFEVQLTGDVMGNGYTSIALPNQVRTIDKVRLIKRAGSLTDEDDRYAIEGGLLDHLGIATD